MSGVHNEWRGVNWHSCLGAISVQQKFRVVCSLEKDNDVCHRIMQLLAGQLSFLLRAASDTSPTLSNLKYWRFKAGATCLLCSFVTLTTLHILNGFPTVLIQGRCHLSSM